MPEVAAPETTFTGLAVFLSLGRVLVIAELFWGRGSPGRAGSCGELGLVPLGHSSFVFELLFGSFYFLIFRLQKILYILSLLPLIVKDVLR